MPTSSASPPDAFAVLGVGRAATAEEIRAAHRRLVRLHHPDAHPRVGAAAAASAQRRFQKVQEAYDLLRDPARRAELDQHLQRLDAERQRAATEAACAASARDEARAAPRYDVDEIERERQRRDETGGRRYPTPRSPYDTTTSTKGRPAHTGSSQADERDRAAPRRRASSKFKSEQEAIDQLIEELKELRSRPEPLDPPPAPAPVEVSQARRFWREAQTWARWLFEGYNAVWTIATMVVSAIAVCLAVCGWDMTLMIVGISGFAALAGVPSAIIMVQLFRRARMALRQLVDRFTTRVALNRWRP